MLSDFTSYFVTIIQIPWQKDLQDVTAFGS